ncbi:MAG TPA: LL-diaminopimelate aminotransferase [Nitrospiria bacterium]|nr:LL-diaminopimelate aminotransferase [Nitrospiria bacterium]
MKKRKPTAHKPEARNKRQERFKPAERILTLPPYLFAAIDRMKQEAIRKGIDIINLGIGDPDLPTPPHIIERLQRAATDPRHHQYPSYEGMLQFREAVARWYKARFNVTLDPATEVLTLIGSKEGIGHLPLGVLNPGDVALVPSPGYPVYAVATRFAGGVTHPMPLRASNRFHPDFGSIPSSILKRAKLCFLNYPNNPTAATTTPGFFVDTVAFARRHGLILAHDAAYSEIYYDGRRPPSFLQVDGAKEVGIEFHSLSKTFNMTGWRIGFAVGRRDVIAALGKVKSNLDSGVFQAIQEAGIAALESPAEVTDAIRWEYQQRRDLFVPGLQQLGLEAETPAASFYVWIRTPKKVTSAAFTARLLQQAGIVSTPGNGFGEAGEGYVRMTMTVPPARLADALDRLKRL